VVVRLKGGDPFVFGRGGEEALYLHERGIDFEVVPGVTSAVAVPAYAGIPVTHRDLTSSLAIVTGHERPDKGESSIRWDKLATGAGTLVFLMGIENLHSIVANLVLHGRSAGTPCALIRWGTLPGQHVVTGTLADIEEKAREAGVTPPGIIVVGEVVSLRPRLAWFERRPLFGRRVVVTRARSQASNLTSLLEELGAEVLEVPTIEVVPVVDMSALDRELSRLGQYDWVLFTSVNGVELFFERLLACGGDVRDLHGAALGAIGPATAEALRRRGLRVEVIPEEYRAEGMLRALGGRVRPGQRVLLPRARGARTVLPDMLRGQGAEVTEVALYEAVRVPVEPEARERVLQGEADAITFTSSSTVRNFVAALGKEAAAAIPARTRMVCIGPVTADTARSLGLRVDAVAEEYTIPGLVQALLRLLGED
jgi:uroporphyrinogen III methyltransferase/synthase